MSPGEFQPPVGQPVELTLTVGNDFAGTTLPRINDRFTDFGLRVPDGKRLPIAGAVGADPAGRFIPERPGLYVANYQTTRTFVEIPPRRFNKYLTMEGLEHVLPWRVRLGEATRNAKEYYSRSVKTLINVAPDQAPANHKRHGYRHDFGMPIELIPLRNPYTLKPGDRLPVRVRYLDQPLVNVLVIAFHELAPNVKQTVRTDAHGEAGIILHRPGQWLVKATHIIRAPEAALHEYEWESFWAALTFELNAPAAALPHSVRKPITPTPKRPAPWENTAPSALADPPR